MSKNFRERVIVSKKEAVEGTDIVPVGANAILCSEPTITPMAGGTVKRNLVRQTLGADPSIHVNTHVLIEFGVELAGSGAAGTAPAYSELLTACGTTETVNAGVDVQYDLHSNDGDTMSHYFNVDGTKHALLGSRGNVKLMLPPNDVSHLMFSFVGLWTAPSETAAPTPDFSSFQDPLIISKDNTPTFTLHGFAGVLENLELDFGNQIIHRDRPGSKRVLRTDRQGSGSITIEAPALTTKDFFAIAKAETEGALQIIHGTTAGNIIQIDAPKLQLLQPTYGNADSLVTLQMGVQLNPNAGDDEIKLTIK